jgi:hypothetical protein
MAETVLTGIGETEPAAAPAAVQPAGTDSRPAAAALPKPAATGAAPPS